MSTNSTSLVIQHAISVQTATHGSFQMDDFSSLKFSKLYMSAEIPGSCKLYMLQLTEASTNMLTALENFIQFINDNGGFTVVWWYKRGVINDKSLIASRKINNVNGGNTAANYNTNEEDMQVDSGEISYRIVSINSTNHGFLDPTYQLGRDLGRLKFDVKQIENTPTI